ncbi:hypothetical protein ACFQZT_02010 [Paenibacillus sp. GCM10027628]|uniref:hypothetical protein n=1 Tax=Paenibacillus sp. GCM10027628 TaxID=3273413 RepID=UPI003632964B
MLKPMKKARSQARPKKGDKSSGSKLVKLYNGPTVLNKTSGVTIVAKGSFDFESVV